MLWSSFLRNYPERGDHVLDSSDFSHKRGLQELIASDKVPVIFHYRRDRRDAKDVEIEIFYERLLSL